MARSGIGIASSWLGSPEKFASEEQMTEFVISEWVRHVFVKVRAEDTEECRDAHLKPGFLAELAHGALYWCLAEILTPTGERPQSVVGPPDQADLTSFIHDEGVRSNQRCNWLRHFNLSCERSA